MDSLFLILMVLAYLAPSALTRTPQEILKNIKVSFSTAAIQSGITLPNITYADVSEAKSIPGVEAFDFIIVGAGPAGSILANRLSQNPSWKILLLESGDEPDFMTDVSGLAALQMFTKYNWRYLMQKQENMFLGLKDETMCVRTGKGLGGSTLINFNIYVRCNRNDFDSWATMGNEGWSYNEVLPYFKKFEDSTVRIQDKEYRNTGGELSVQDISFRTKYVDAFVDACEQLGYRYVDYNGANQTGVSYIQATTRRGLRCSSEKAFLRPVKDKSNLKIRVNSHAVKVIIDPKKKRACGVKYISKGSKRLAKALKEVILTAGPFNSPQLLMLSGIGPPMDLKRLKIPLIKNLPVGKKMHDHVFFFGLIFKVNETVGFNLTEFLDASSFVQLHLNGTGPLSSLMPVEGVAYLKTNISTHPNPTFPDMELLFMGCHLNFDTVGIFKHLLSVSDKIYDAIYKPLEGQNVIGVLPVLLHPKSRGSVALKSANPLGAPIIRGNYYTDPNGCDVKTMIAGIREAQRLFKMPAFQKFGAEQVATPVPGCEDPEYDSDEYWECAVRYLSHTIYHQTTTCKMGPKKDKEAVVNNRLRVYGITNMRVADSSIIPMPLSGHSLGPTYMIAEKAAAMIKEDWTS